MAESLALILFYVSLPDLVPARIAAAIAGVEPGMAADDVHVDVLAGDGHVLAIDIAFGGHAIRVVGFDAPAPQDSFAPQLENAHLRPDHKRAISFHRAHLIASYMRDDTTGIERIIALYKVAAALRDEGLTGVLCPTTWMIQPPEMLPNLVKADVFRDFRHSPAAMLAIWLGYIKFHKPDGQWWLATKGGPLYGIPDFACLVANLSEADAVVNLFGDIVSYAFQSGKRLAVGHTMEVGETHLRLRAVYEYADFLGADTLIIERAEQPKKRGWLFGRG